MMVGSIETMVQKGENTQRGQECRYFAFGVLRCSFPCNIFITRLSGRFKWFDYRHLVEKGKVEWDEDPLIDGRHLSRLSFVSAWVLGKADRRIDSFNTVVLLEVIVIPAPS